MSIYHHFWLISLLISAVLRGSEPQEIYSELREEKVIRFLALVQWRDEFNRTHSGWDTGPDMLAAGRVAVQEINNRTDILTNYTLEMIEGRHEACGLTEANLGIKELASKGIGREDLGVVAVLGLFCSTSAQHIAPVAGDVLYAGLLYDQVWALALAINNAIELYNISMEDYSYDQYEVTDKIEESLKAILSDHQRQSWKSSPLITMSTFHHLRLFVLLISAVLRSESQKIYSGERVVRFLALVQWRDEFNRTHSGWDTGPDMLAAGRVAVQEINNRTDILTNYTLEMIEGRHEACGLTEANLGIKELASKGIGRENGSVVAVLGLFCSTSAQHIAPVAGRAGLIQLSAANSPLFSRDLEKFPHLWRILVSAKAYTDMMLSLMRHFGWEKVGLFQDLNTLFHSGIAESFIDLINKTNDKYTITYHGGILHTREELIDTALENIKTTGTRIVFLQTTGPQTAKFLCAAANKNMVYPNYLWIITDFFLTGLIGELKGLSNCNEELLRKASNGRDLQSEEGKEEERPVIRFLALVQWRDEFNRTHSGWDTGPDMLAAGRVAVQEINNRTDILTNYTLEMIEGRHEACGLTEANLGIKELASKGIGRENGSVVAVLGLFCSTSAQHIAPVAGKAGLIQLSAANSPLFSSDLHNFPHLWRILVSAKAYADMMLSLMKRFGWRKVGVVQDLGTIFHSGIAESFIDLIQDNDEYTINYHGGIIHARDELINSALDNIKATRTRIVFLQTTGPQTAKFLCAAANKNMFYRDYLWIITDYFLTGLIKELEGLSNCNEELLRKGINGSLIGFFDLQDTDAVFTNASGFNYSEYEHKYEEELNETRKEYYSSDDDVGDLLYAGLLYDQVWALALAINNAIELYNVSMEDYSYDQYEVTDKIEKSLGRVSFRGATGHIMFSEDREVSTPINIYQYDTVHITAYFDPPPDSPESEMVPLSLYCAISLYVATLVVIVIVTIILICLLYMRSKPQIKASSLLFSLIMFIGCYLICATCIVRITYAAFPSSEIIFEILCNVQSVFFFNGFSLVFVTLFIRLLRIKKIFGNKSLTKYLGCCWTNKAMTLVVIVITIIPNLMLVGWIGFDRLKRETVNVTVDVEPLVYNEEYFMCTSQLMYLWYAMVFTYTAFILLLIVILAACTRKIKHRDFKDTKKVNAFIFIFVLTFTITGICLWLFREINQINVGHTVIISGLLLLVLECQVMLFLPKIMFCNRRRHRSYSVTENVMTLFSFDKHEKH
uniref:G-protein coupled receptors family 3 profile domain-containing protein n=1 Tax=Amphimedon queenslandica TaxID=400682 RepID=A0A1X7V2H3_AMPQE